MSDRFEITAESVGTLRARSYRSIQNSVLLANPSLEDYIDVVLSIISMDQFLTNRVLGKNAAAENLKIWRLLVEGKKELGMVGGLTANAEHISLGSSMDKFIRTKAENLMFPLFNYDSTTDRLVIDNLLASYEYGLENLDYDTFYEMLSKEITSAIVQKESGYSVG